MIFIAPICKNRDFFVPRGTDIEANPDASHPLTITMSYRALDEREWVKVTVEVKQLELPPVKERPSEDNG